MTSQSPTTRNIIQGNKTWLRSARLGFSQSELERRYRWSRDEGLQYWSGSIPGGRSYQHFTETLLQRDWPPDGHRISFAIFAGDDELVGMVSCYGIDYRKHTGEIGIYIGEKNLWGRGYGTDALIAFLRFLFGEWRLDSVYLHTYLSNERARRSYERVGFVAGETRRRYAPRVGYHQDVRMTMTREEFVRRHGLDHTVVAS